ncbi:hypothetical protein ES703_40695 [subsurface metagenome]
MSSWKVLIKDHHEGYINWEEYLHNDTVLQQNQPKGVKTMLRSAAREGRLGATGKPFTISMIRNIRRTYSIPAPVLKLSDELTVKELAEKLEVSYHNNLSIITATLTAYYDLMEGGCRCCSFFLATNCLLREYAKERVEMT